MSDADDQLGGTGGEYGRKPGQPDPQSKPGDGTEDPNPDANRDSTDEDPAREASAPDQ